MTPRRWAALAAAHLAVYTASCAVTYIAGTRHHRRHTEKR